MELTSCDITGHLQAGLSFTARSRLQTRRCERKERESRSAAVQAQTGLRSDTASSQQNQIETVASELPLGGGGWGGSAGHSLLGLMPPSEEVVEEVEGEEETCVAVELAVAAVVGPWWVRSKAPEAS